MPSSVKTIYSWVLAVIFAVIGLLALMIPVEVGDSYCGAVLYDTSTSEPCTSAMQWRRVVVIISGLVLVSIVLRQAWVGSTGRRFSRVAACIFLAISLVAFLVTLNRLLQPIQSEWCGSVVNRHRTYEAALERRCDDLLAPYWRAAIGAGIVGMVSVFLGIRLWNRTLPDSP